MSNNSELAAQIKRLKKYAEKDVPNAHRMAINRTLKKAKTALVKAVSKDTGIKQKVLNQSKASKSRVYVDAAKGGKGASAAKLKFNVKGIPIINLNPKFVGSGIMASGYWVSGGFIANGTKGSGRGRLKQSHVLQRSSEAQYPVKIVRVEIAPFVNKNGLKIVKKKFKEDFTKEYNSAIKVLKNRT